MGAMCRPGVSGAFGFEHPQFRWVWFCLLLVFIVPQLFAKVRCGAMVWQHSGGRHCPTCSQLLLTQSVGTGPCRYAGFPLFLLLMGQRFCEKWPPALYFGKVCWPTCSQLLLTQPVWSAHCRYAGFPLFQLLMAQRFCEKWPPALYFGKLCWGRCACHHTRGPFFRKMEYRKNLHLVRELPSYYSFPPFFLLQAELRSACSKKKGGKE